MYLLTCCCLLQNFFSPKTSYYRKNETFSNAKWVDHMTWMSRNGNHRSHINDYTIICNGIFQINYPYQVCCCCYDKPHLPHDHVSSWYFKQYLLWTYYFTYCHLAVSSASIHIAASHDLLVIMLQQQHSYCSPSFIQLLIS